MKGQRITEIATPQRLLLECIAATAPIWKQNPDAPEPVATAFRRLFGRRLRDTPPMCFGAIPVDGGRRFLTVHVIPGGIVHVFDPHPLPRGHWTIRTMTAETRKRIDRVTNIGAGLAHIKKRSNPFTGGFEDGRVGEAGLRWAQAIPG